VWAFPKDAFAELAVHAQNLKPTWKVVLHQPGVKTRALPPYCFAMVFPASVYVVNRQERHFSLPAATTHRATVSLEAQPLVSLLMLFLVFLAVWTVTMPGNWFAATTSDAHPSSHSLLTRFVHVSIYSSLMKDYRSPAGFWA
jgi:hypothetical protein